MLSPYKILKSAQLNHYAIGAFNACNLELIKAIVISAHRLKSSVIIATSEGESEFIGMKKIRKIIDVWQEELNIPIILHLDHGHSLEKIKEAVSSGYDSVHFDGSSLCLEDNIKTTKKVVNYVKKKNPGIIVEGELGYLRGSSELHSRVEIKEDDLTDPDEALEFIEKTGVDSLAVAIGNIHGIIKKQSNSSGLRYRNPHLYLSRLKQIKEKVKDKVFLVLHGGSGTPEGDIKKAIDLGIIKVNINTELRIAFSDTLRKILKEKKNEIVPYRIMPAVIDAVEKVVREKIKLFGSVNSILK